MSFSSCSLTSDAQRHVWGRRADIMEQVWTGRALVLTCTRVAETVKPPAALFLLLIQTPQRSEQQVSMKLALNANAVFNAVSNKC